MTFEYRKGQTEPLETYTIANSEVLQVGEAVRLDNDGFLVTCPAGSTVLGVVQGFVGKNGEVPTTNGAGANFSPRGSFTVAADNETVGKYKAQVLVDKGAIYAVSADATLGSTTGSNLPGYRMDHTSGGLVLDESTAATTAAQWVSHGVDPTNSSQVLVSIFEHQLV